MRRNAPSRTGARSADESPADVARLEAWHLLGRINQDRAFLARLGRQEASGFSLRAATEYAAGVTRWRRWLDFLIDELTGGGSRVEEGVRRVLQIGLLDLLVLESAPHAAVFEAVRLARHAVRPGVSGFVNGVLRTAQRRKQALPMPAYGDVAEDLAVRWSHPTWLVRRWITEFGAEDTRRLLETNNEAPVHTLRLSSRRISPGEVAARLAGLGVEVLPGLFLEDARRVRSVQPIREAGLFEEGLVAVQDEAAMLVVRLLDPKPGESLLDACAAPGGKSIYAAERMDNKGRIVSMDIHGGKLALVATAARLRGIDIVQTMEADAGAISPSDRPEGFDAVLLDAPCTGTGVLAKRADLRWNRRPEQLKELAALQTRLLDAVSTVVKPGGRLVYATCSIEREENQDQVAAFLARRTDFQLEPPGPEIPPQVVDTQGFMVVLPHRHGLDGAFAARLRRAGS